MTKRPNKRPPSNRGGGGRHKRPHSAPHTQVVLFGRHAVGAALANPARRHHRLWLTPSARSQGNWPDDIATEEIDAETLDNLVPAGAPHQGIALATSPLPAVALEEMLAFAQGRPVVVLDQVTDPHNVGAIFRSARAFGAAALVTQDRHSPPETGTLAKAASGTLETLPWVRVTNLSRALDRMAEAGYWRLGLVGEARTPLRTVAVDAPPVALVLGAEGRGLRPNVSKHCDQLAFIPMDPAVESLNVSNAAAVALYALSRPGAPD